jgi:hypothetical protein
LYCRYYIVSLLCFCALTSLEEDLDFYLDKVLLGVDPQKVDYLFFRILFY